jgi:hypothetical protein
MPKFRPEVGAVAAGGLRLRRSSAQRSGAQRRRIALSTAAACGAGCSKSTTSTARGGLHRLRLVPHARRQHPGVGDDVIRKLQEGWPKARLDELLPDHRRCFRPGASSRDRPGVQGRGRGRPRSRRGPRARLPRYLASWPPSTGSECPFTNEASSEQSHVTTRATSSARPGRPIGISAMMGAMVSG